MKYWQYLPEMPIPVTLKEYQPTGSCIVSTDCAGDYSTN